MLSHPIHFIGAAVFAAALVACSYQSPKAVLDPAKATVAYTVGARLAAQDRTEQAEHRKAMSRILDARVTQTKDKDRTISFFIQLRNKCDKRITSLDSGLFVYGEDGQRIGMAELHLAKPIAAHATSAFWYPMRYVRFSEDAGTMRLAAGRPKRVRLQVTEVKYADGADAGYDD